MLVCCQRIPAASIVVDIGESVVRVPSSWFASQKAASFVIVLSLVDGASMSRTDEQLEMTSS